MEYLLKINQTFYFRIAIPTDLQQHFSKKSIKKSLHTASKTQARKLLTAELYGIQQIFYKLRLGKSYMYLDKPSQRAIEVFKKRYGADESIHEEAQLGEPCIYGTPWKYKDEIWKIEAKIEAGYIEGEDGFFNLNDAPRKGLHTTPALVFAPAFVEAPTFVDAPKVPPPTSPTGDSLTLAEARKCYIAHCVKPTKKYRGKPRAASTLASENKALDKLEAYLRTDKVLLSDMPNDYYLFAVDLKDNGKLATSSVNTYLNCLGRFFKYLKEYDYIATTPNTKYLDRTPEDKLNNPNKAYSNEQLRLLFNHLINNKPTLLAQRKKHLGLIYLLLGLLHSGCRITEFTEDSIIKEYNGVPVFDIPTMTKNIRTSIRYVPLHTRLVQLGFKDYSRKHGFPANVRNQSKVLSTALCDLGIKTKNNEYTIHSCRSTFDSKLNGKMPDGLRKRLMGHALTGMDINYVEQLPDEVLMYQEAVNKLIYDIDYGKIKAFLLDETKRLYP